MHLKTSRLVMDPFQYNAGMEYIACDFLQQKNVLITTDGNRIESLLPTSSSETDLCITPGFCDLQVNGGFGIDLNSPNLTVEDVIDLNRKLLAHGVTSWCPTVITASDGQMLHNLGVINEACQTDQLLEKCIAGIHLEGPYLSPVDGARGAHPVQFLRQPDLDEFAAFQRAAGGRIRIVTIAPELNGAMELIAALSQQGIIVALGHTLASSAQIRAAVDAGARLATHLGNGIPAQIDRHHNPLVDLLAEESLFASVIFDGHHLPANLRKLIVKAKGLDRVLMVSDATRLAGMPPGRYDEPIGGSVELAENGRLSLAGTPYLAGAAMTLLEDVNAMLAEHSLTFTELLALSMQNPRAFLGIEQQSLVLLKFDPTTSRAEVIFTAIDGHIYTTQGECE